MITGVYAVVFLHGVGVLFSPERNRAGRPHRQLLPACGAYSGENVYTI